MPELYCPTCEKMVDPATHADHHRPHTGTHPVTETTCDDPKCWCHDKSACVSIDNKYYRNYFEEQLKKLKYPLEVPYQNQPPEHPMQRDVFWLPEGYVTLEWPIGMSTQSYALFYDWLVLMKRKIEAHER